MLNVFDEFSCQNLFLIIPILERRKFNFSIFIEKKTRQNASVIKINAVQQEKSIKIVGGQSEGIRQKISLYNIEIKAPKLQNKFQTFLKVVPGR